MADFVEKPRTAAVSGIAFALAVVVLLVALHIALGAKSLSLSTVVEALLARDENAFDHRIVWDLRLPRALSAVAVGAALSVAGALMQGVTRNPLAEPGLLGLLAGASFAVVMFSFFFGTSLLVWVPWIACLGALAAALVVHLIALRAPGGATPLTLTLTGAAVSAFLGALIMIAHLIHQDSYETLRIWLSGSLAGGSVDQLIVAGPWIAIGILAAVLRAPQVTALSMGDDVARGLGVRTGWTLICGRPQRKR